MSHGTGATALVVKDRFQRRTGETRPLLLPVLPNAPLASRDSACPMAPISLRFNENLDFMENAAFNPERIVYGPDYDNDQSHSPRFAAHMREMLAVVSTQVPGGGRLVEVGCGKGAFLELAAQAGFAVRGFDATYEGTNPAVERRYVHARDRIEADVVVLRHVLEHIRAPQRFLAMLAGVFGPAQLFVEVPNYRWIQERQTFVDVTYEHVNYFSPEALARLFRPGRAAGGLCFDGQYQYVTASLADLDPQFEAYYAGKGWQEVSFASLFPRLRQHIDTVERHLTGGGTLYVWGAATKGCLFLAHCAAMGRVLDHVGFAVDINPGKIGKFLAGSGVEIRSKESLFHAARPGDVVLIANPAYRSEIEHELARAGCRGLHILTL